MQKPLSPSSICEEAAERVQYWIGGDKGERFCSPQKPSPSSLRKHQCDPVKIPRIPSAAQHLPLYGYAQKTQLPGVKKRAIVNDREESSPSSLFCSANQKNPFLLENTPFLERVVTSWQLKEHFLAFRKFKGLKKQHTSPKKYKIALLNMTRKSPAISEEQGYWEEMIRSKENRLFNVDRIIKFLVD